uniref:Uncharacterized protein n=1 Tax=Arundo donax TaxID=35708 RepID=A0A0A8YD01_ARUDO
MVKGFGVWTAKQQSNSVSVF